MDAVDDFKLESVAMHQLEMNSKTRVAMHQLEMDSKSNFLERKMIMDFHRSNPNWTGQDCHSIPGFRFHPTDQELVFYYLINKRENSNIVFHAVGEVDFNKCEPWDLPAKAKQRDNGSFYFFSQKDKKYPTGSRTNRATDAGYWKATGKDREIESNGRVGMKKTLVFYKGRAPIGEKTDWIMHEYRLEGEPKPDQEDWVVSRVFQKKSSSSKKVPSKFTPESTYDTVYDADYVQYQHPPHHSMILKYVDSPSTSNSVKPIYTNPGHTPGEPQNYFQGEIFPEHGKIFSRSNSAMKGRRDLYSSGSFEPLASNWDMGSPTRI